MTADAGGICLKSGNAALLRGSSSAADSNAAIVEALRQGLADADLPADAVQLVPGPREVTAELMAARGPGRRPDPARRCRADRRSGPQQRRCR